MENEGLWRSSTVHLNSFGANVGHVGNIFAYRCFLFAIPMLRVCRAAPLKSRFRSQDILTSFLWRFLGRPGSLRTLGKSPPTLKSTTGRTDINITRNRYKYCPPLPLGNEAHLISHPPPIGKRNAFDPPPTPTGKCNAFDFPSTSHWETECI